METDRHIHRWTERQTETDRQIATDKQTKRDKQRQTDKRIDRQTER